MNDEEYIPEEDKEQAESKFLEKIEKLEGEIIEYKFILQQSKEIEYKELVLDLLYSIKTELEDKESKLSKEDILKNLKTYIRNFIKDNRVSKN